MFRSYDRMKSVIIIVAILVLVRDAHASCPNTADGNVLCTLAASVHAPACNTFATTCDASGNVVSLIVQNNNSTYIGTMPTEIALLTHLQTFYAGVFCGTIPTILGQMTSLTNLSVSSFWVTGTLPTELGLLTNLQSFEWKSQFMTGTMPTEVGHWSNLQVLNIADFAMAVTGTVPTELFQCTKMTSLTITNGFSGTLPTLLGLLTRLQTMTVGYKFSGTIPTEVGNMVSITFFDIMCSSITGTIPTEIGNLRSMTNFDIGTKLSGTIPTELGECSQIAIIGWYGNPLCGTIPTQLGNLQKLIELDIRSPATVSGTIPTEIGKILALTAISLLTGTFCGTIPTEVANLNQMRMIDLSSNHFCGTIPTSFGGMTYMIGINLAHNAFSGSIPTELQRLSSLYQLALDDNCLVGSVDVNSSLLTSPYFHCTAANNTNITCPSVCACNGTTVGESKCAVPTHTATATLPPPTCAVPLGSWSGSCNNINITACGSHQCCLHAMCANTSGTHLPTSYQYRKSYGTAPTLDNINGVLLLNGNVSNPCACRTDSATPTVSSSTTSTQTHSPSVTHTETASRLPPNACEIPMGSWSGSCDNFNITACGSHQCCMHAMCANTSGTHLPQSYQYRKSNGAAPTLDNINGVLLLNGNVSNPCACRTDSPTPTPTATSSSSITSLETKSRSGTPTNTRSSTATSIVRACHPYTPSLPMVTTTVLNNTDLQFNITVPYGYFAMELDTNLTEIGNYASCTNLNVLNQTGPVVCVTDLQLQCMEYANGFGRSPDIVSFNYLNASTTYTFDANISDSTTRTALGMYIANNTLFFPVKFCKLVPQYIDGVILPLNLSNQLLVWYPGSLDCYLNTMEVNLTISTSSPINTYSSVITTSVGADARLTMTVTNPQLWQNCTFTVTPSYALDCSALACTVATAQASYNVNISAVCVTPTGILRDLPPYSLNTVANQVTLSNIIAAPSTSALWVAGSGDAYTVVLPYFVQEAEVTSASPPSTYVVAVNDAATGTLGSTLTVASNGDRTLSFIPGELHPGQYSVNILMDFVAPSKQKFNIEQATGFKTGTVQLTFTVSSSSATSPPPPKNHNMIIIGIVVGIAVVVTTAAIFVTVVKRLRRSDNRIIVVQGKVDPETHAIAP